MLWLNHVNKDLLHVRIAGRISVPSGIFVTGAVPNLYILKRQGKEIRLKPPSPVSL